MGYLVLARKYRPQNFEDVVKQDHVTRTLQNAITADRMAHAVLFSGPRGTGKTTVARILAKAMNCERGPTANPCNACESCRQITASSAVDVFEIDGASNNGVEQVRELRDNIKYMPAHSRFKIYIIDEVHMLSTAAFNALLKTLEEPPVHVMFIFATTEPHKIPLTILSRCRRHEFRRIELEAISDHLDSICRKENINLDRESLDLISREAGGCMRDALSLLDQVMTCAAGGLSENQVLDILGVVDRKMLFEISSAILAADISQILYILHEINDRGQDMKKLYANLLEHFRNLLVVKLGKSPEKLVDVPAHELRLMAEQTADYSASHISQLFDVLFKEEPSIRFSAQPYLALEVALIKMCQLKPVLSVDELIERLSQVKDAIESGAVIQVAPDIKKERPLRNAQKATCGKNNLDQTCLDSSAEGKVEASEANFSGPIEIESAPGTGASGSKSEFLHPNDLASGLNIGEYSKSDKKIGFKENPESIWEKVVRKVSEKNGLLAAMLAKSKAIEVKEERLEIEAGDDGFQYKKIKKSAEAVRQACIDLFGVKPEIFVRANEHENSDYRNKLDREKRLRQEALNHPLVDEAIKIFDGEVIEVKILKEDS